jgi:hypothetical protein
VDQVSGHGLTKKEFFHGHDVETGMVLKGGQVIKVGKGELMLLTMIHLE